MKAIELVPEIATRRALNELRERLLEALKDNLLKIVFFGSRARGVFEPDSDLDLLILVRKKDHETADRIFSIAQEIEDAILLYKISFSIHLYDIEGYLGLKKAGSLFIKNIESEGLVVYERVNDD
jgi:predicted nucleotidyltransferase